MLYLLFLLCVILYFGKMMYRNYQKEVTTAKRCICIGTGVVAVASFLVSELKRTDAGHSVDNYAIL